MTDNYTPVLTDGQIQTIGLEMPAMPTPGSLIKFARIIERAAIEGYQQKISQPSGFGGRCWQCWPKICKCPSSPDEVESIKSERYLLDRELQRENRRAREFAIALAALSSGITQHRDRLMAAHGLDGVPEDLHRLGEQAKQAAELLDEPRNADRVSAIYKYQYDPKRMEPAPLMRGFLWRPPVS